MTESRGCKRKYEPNIILLFWVWATEMVMLFRERGDAIGGEDGWWGGMGGQADVPGGYPSGHYA